MASGRFTFPMQIEDVARQAGLCRRRLEDAFKRHVGRSMPKKILRLRMRDAKRLLRETELKHYVIAERCGFGSSAHMNFVFQRELGAAVGVSQFHLKRPQVTP